MEHDAFETEAEWFDSRRVIAEPSKVVVGLGMSDTRVESLGRISDSEFLHAMDQSESNVVLGDYAGWGKPYLLKIHLVMFMQEKLADKEVPIEDEDSAVAMAAVINGAAFIISTSTITDLRRTGLM